MGGGGGEGKKDAGDGGGGGENEVGGDGGGEGSGTAAEDDACDDVNDTLRVQWIRQKGPSSFCPANHRKHPRQKFTLDGERIARHNALCDGVKVKV